MAGTYLGFPFNEELFSYLWAQEADTQKTAIEESGAMVADSTIANLISNGSDLYTAPIYEVLGGEEQNYDGATDMTTEYSEAKTQTGIVYGRMKAWTAKDFVADYNSGANPMASIVSQVNKYWQHQRQNRIVGILNGVFESTNSDYADWNADHTLDLSAASGTVTAANRLGATSIGDGITKACGDNMDKFSLAIMHSHVANGLAGLQLMEYAKYTDPAGIQRQLQIGYINGMTVVVDDGVPVDKTGTDDKYTTYLLGNGVLRFANAPVRIPVEYQRDPAKNGGEETLFTRVRETIHPNGFEYIKPTSGYTSSPTNEQLFAKANWKLKVAPKGIAMARLVSNV